LLLDTCKDLADGKISGKSYPEIGSEILGFKAGRHIDFYRKTNGQESKSIEYYIGVWI
jgi:toxin ParE1/3/4